MGRQGLLGHTDEIVQVHIGPTAASTSKFTVRDVAEIITILLANSNPRNISLLRDRLGGGWRDQSPIWPITPIDHYGPDRWSFEHVQRVIERRSVREGRSQALRAL